MAKTALFLCALTLVGCGDPQSEVVVKDAGVTPSATTNSIVIEDGGSGRPVLVPDAGSLAVPPSNLNEDAGSPVEEPAVEEPDIAPSEDAGLPEFPEETPAIEDDAGVVATPPEAPTDAGVEEIPPEPLCVPGETECQGSTLSTCAADGQAWESTECAVACLQGACVSECYPGDQTCDGLGVQTCGADGTWTTTAQCPFVCSAGACTGECSPGAVQCNGQVPETCDSSGTWVPGTTCEFVCTNGACDGSCTPDAQQCNGKVSQTCTAEGVWTDVQICDFLCTGEGVCSGECLPGNQDCNGDIPRTCSAQGIWTSGSECPFLCTDGACTGVCTPGATDCKGLTPRVCDADGAWIAGTTDCDFVCSTGACTGVCTPGAQQCDVNGDVEICDATGQWTVTEDCTNACVDGACTGVCTPDDRRCSNTTSQVCGSLGQWQNDTICPFVCTGLGVCSGECVPGTVECDGVGTKTCGNDGFWQATVACPSASNYPSTYHIEASCSAGACGFDCLEGYADCNDNDNSGISCETSLSDSLNCGACGNSCGGGVCSSESQCLPASWSPSLGNSSDRITSEPAVDAASNVYFGKGAASTSYSVLKGKFGQSTSSYATASGSVNKVMSDNTNICWIEATSASVGNLVCEGSTKLSNQTGLTSSSLETSLRNGHVIWTSGSSAATASTGGGTVSTLETFGSGNDNMGVFFGTSTYGYWVNSTGVSDYNCNIKRKSFAGGSTETLVQNQRETRDLLVEGNKLYWVTEYDEDALGNPIYATVWELDLSTNTTRAVYQHPEAFAYMDMLTTDGTYLYWFSQQSTYQVMRAPLAGGPAIVLTTLPSNMIPNGVLTRKLTAQGGYLYWTSLDRLGLYRLSTTHWSDY